MAFNGVSVVSLLAGGLLVLVSLRLIFRRKLLIQFLWSLVAMILLLTGTAALLGGLDLIGYKKILAEEPIVTLEFQQSGVRQYQVNIIDNEGRQSLRALTGDEWQLDVRLIKWGDALAALGVSPLYRLDRLSGRYADVREEISQKKSAHGFDQTNGYGIDIWSLARRFPQLRGMIDTQYGSATFLPMADGAIYRISINGAGLVARPVNEEARTVVANWN